MLTEFLKWKNENNHPIGGVQLKYRTHKEFTLSEIGIGCYALSGAYGEKKCKAFKQLLTRAYELGINFFDTAPTYGDAEQILGEVVKPFREEVYIATKISPEEGIKSALTEEYVRKACNQSLERLQTTYIDLYQIHYSDPNTPIKETVRILEELVDEGKIRRYGVCHLPSEQIVTYCQTGKVFSVMMELSAVARDARKQLLPLCQKYKTGAIAFSTTGRGLLTGKFQNKAAFDPGDIRNIDPLFQRERYQSGLKIAEKIAALGRQNDMTIAQTAIAWVLSQPGIICALTGPSSISHLEENVKASGWTFSSNELEELDRFFNQQDEWLEENQRKSITRLLTEPLSHSASIAFTDLVYVIETAIGLEIISEAEILPLFQELFMMRENLANTTGPQLGSIQSRLRELIL